MQVIQVRSGFGRQACSEALNGLLIQTPGSATNEIEMVINDVEILMGSTVYFSTVDGASRLQVVPIEGTARVSAANSTRTVVAGAQTQIPLDNQGNAAGPPSDATSYANVPVVENIPADLPLLERSVEPVAPLSDAAVDVLNSNQPLFNAINLDDTRNLLAFVVNEGDSGNVADYLINVLGYTNLGPEAEDYLQNMLGYSLDDFPNYGREVLPDSDGDGISDASDACPDTGGVANNQGCPAPNRPGDDLDLDGVADVKDLCPNVPGRADNSGCPRQS